MGNALGLGQRAGEEQTPPRWRLTLPHSLVHVQQGSPNLHSIHLIPKSSETQSSQHREPSFQNTLQASLWDFLGPSLQCQKMASLPSNASVPGPTL